MFCRLLFFGVMAYCKKKQQQKPKQLNKQRGNMLNIVAGTMLCFLKHPPLPPPFGVLNAPAAITYALILSIHI